MDDITNVDKHAKGCLEDSGIKNLCQYYDLYAQRNTLFLTNVFENILNNWAKISELDPVYFPSAPGLAWQVCLDKIEVKPVGRY